jgi:hypothetical protein
MSEVRNVYFVQSDILVIPQCMYAAVILSTMSRIFCNIYFSKVNGLQTSSANPQNFGDLQNLLDFANVAICGSLFFLLLVDLQFADPNS